MHKKFLQKTWKGQTTSDTLLADVRIILKWVLKRNMLQGCELNLAQEGGQTAAHVNMVMDLRVP
jgi:hypothetical protein